MGGEGSGRPTKEASIVKSMYQGQHPVGTTGAATGEFFLPNHSGITSHPEFKKEVGDLASTYVPYTGATANVDLATKNLTANNLYTTDWGSKIGTADRYWKVEVLDLGPYGSYPMFKAYTPIQVFTNVGAIADSLIIFDTQTDNYMELTFSANDLSAIGQIIYQPDVNRFVFDEINTGAVDVVVNGNISATNLSGTNTGDQNLSGYVPYTGATTAVDLGNNSLTITRSSDVQGLYVNKTTGTVYPAKVRGYNGLEVEAYNAAGTALLVKGRQKNEMPSNQAAAFGLYQGATPYMVVDTTTGAEKITLSINTNITSTLNGVAGVFSGNLSAVDLTLTGKQTLPSTTTSALGVIEKNSKSWLHDYHHPTGNTATPAGKNIFLGEDVGNFTMGSGATFVHHGSYNIGIGNGILQNVTNGTSNLGIGREALEQVTTGNHNTGLGFQALDEVTTGSYNIGIGGLAGDTITTGNYNICIGDGSDVKAAGDLNEIVIGRSLTGAGSNTTSIGDSSCTDFYLYGNVVSQNSAHAFYFGGKTTNGSWRIIRSGNDLKFQRYEGSPLAWVDKSTISA
jgi:hypothetical protein